VEPLIPLHCLHTGQTAHVRRILGPADDVHRLREFGFRDGTEIQMFRPGNPCIIRLAGNKVLLRADELLHVFVKPLPRAG
jgi:ferrous iron transport protein A